MNGNGGYWPKVLTVQKPKWLDWCLSRTSWEPRSVAMPWIFRKPSNRECLFVILARCQVDLGLEIPPPPTQISLDFNLPLSLFRYFLILSKVEFQPGCSLIHLFNTPLLITYHTLRSVKHGGWISEYNQALTVLWWWDEGERHACKLSQHGALSAEIKMYTECKDGVVQSLLNSAWGSKWRWGFFLEGICQFRRTGWRE